MTRLEDESGGSFVSHVREVGGRIVERLVEWHLRDVADVAGEFAKEFGAEAWARTAGLWHDLGKYQWRWQVYLRKSHRQRTQDPHQAELGQSRPDRPNHALAGAQYAERQLPHPSGRLLAYAISGHHAGLPDYAVADGANASLSARLEAARTDPVRDELSRAQESVAAVGVEIPGDILAVPALQPDMARIDWARPGTELALSLWIRMLFSCLVDADYLDAERFLDTERSASRQSSLALKELLPLFNVHMAAMIEGASVTTVNAARAEVLDACRSKAAMRPGLFSLTVPTGGGKTLASLAFALEHAVAHGKRRVIYSGWSHRRCRDGLARLNRRAWIDALTAPLSVSGHVYASFAQVHPNPVRRPNFLTPNAGAKDV